MHRFAQFTSSASQNFQQNAFLSPFLALPLSDGESVHFFALRRLLPRQPSHRFGGRSPGFASSLALSLMSIVSDARVSGSRRSPFIDDPNNNNVCAAVSEKYCTVGDTDHLVCLRHVSRMELASFPIFGSDPTAEWTRVASTKASTTSSRTGPAVEYISPVPSVSYSATFSPMYPAQIEVVIFSHRRQL